MSVPDVVEHSVGDRQFFIRRLRTLPRVSKRLQEDSDNGILLEVASGNESAMERCIAKYGGLVWSIAQRYVKDRTAAEDVVQETFMALWKSAGRYDPAVAAEATFIGVLARRRAIDFARKESRQPRLEPLPDAETLPHASTEPTASARCQSRDVREALRTLPAETQQIFSLHFDKGMTHPEVARETGLPLGTVKTRLRRGLIEVRDTLRRLEDAVTPIAANS